MLSKPYESNDDYNFHITHFPFSSSNIPCTPAYGVSILQLLRYALTCSSYICFILIVRRLSMKLLKRIHHGMLEIAIMVDTAILSNNKSLPLANIK